MNELRCPECNKLFLKYNTLLGSKVEIVCSRCKTKLSAKDGLFNVKSNPTYEEIMKSILQGIREHELKTGKKPENILMTKSNLEVIKEHTLWFDCNNSKRTGIVDTILGVKIKVIE